MARARSGDEVFVLVTDVYSEDFEVEGVFSSYELAEAAMLEGGYPGSYENHVKWKGQKANIIRRVVDK